MTIQKYVYTVTELTRNIRKVVESSFPQIWVEGEISNFIKHSSGHMYFSIKDENSVIQAVLFKNINSKLDFEVKNGIKVICFGRVGVYEKRGSYQLYVDKIEPKGIGALQQAFEDLKKKLLKEGLFSKSKKKQIPFLPKAIGVITSPTGAAIKDILNVATRRFANVEIILCPVKVQGKGSAEEIAGAIDLFNEFNKVDVIIAGRGGGSLEDLWSFNEEVVARAIDRSKIPVISAVGHEIDYTISDFAADFRAPTPSAAAELVIPVKEELVRTIKNCSLRLKGALSNLVLQKQQRIDECVTSLEYKMGYLINLKKENLRAVVGKLEALSPLSVLKRGYSITEAVKTKKAVKTAKDLNTDELIKTILAKGSLISRIEKIEPA